MLPERIGRYEVRGVAGSGGFATVYEGFDPRLDARVAIKVLADNWSRDPDVRRRFRQEAVLLRRLHSEQGVPGLVEVFDIDQTESGQPFFVMSWANGGTLGDRAGRSAWPDTAVASVIRSITQSLGHLHARGVVHRDIKPQNLLLRSERFETVAADELIGSNERLVLGDFGLAKDLASNASNMSMVAGTERYMAPEQLVFGGSVDHRADIYAATAMVAELLTGSLDWSALEPSLHAVVRKGTANDPGDRYATMSDWQDALLGVLEPPEQPAVAEPASVERVSPSPVPTEPAAPEPISPGFVSTKDADLSTKRSVPIRALAGLAALIVVAALGFLLLRGGDQLTITGPESIQSGEIATYEVEGVSDDVTWTGPAGQMITGEGLEVTGRLPGQLEIAAMIDGESTTRTIMVERSSDGPLIIGPETVGRGEQGTFVGSVPDGQTFYWIHPTQGQVTGNVMNIVQEGDSFILGLVSVDSAGIERGDQVLVTADGN